MESELSVFNDSIARVWWVGIGGFLGANARFWLGAWIEHRLGDAFPWATFAINISGAFALGVLLPITTEKIGVPNAQLSKLVFCTGFLGAYTTFSTYEYEALSLLQSGAFTRAVVYLVGSVLAGLLAVLAGFGVSRLLT